MNSVLLSVHLLTECHFCDIDRDHLIYSTKTDVMFVIATTNSLYVVIFSFFLSFFFFFFWGGVIPVGGGVSAYARILEDGSIHDSSFPAYDFFFFFFSKRRSACARQFRSFMPGTILNGSASRDNCGRVFPNELRVRSFPC